jgi:plastocyanin
VTLGATALAVSLAIPAGLAAQATSPPDVGGPDQAGPPDGSTAAPPADGIRPTDPGAPSPGTAQPSTGGPPTAAVPADPAPPRASTAATKAGSVSIVGASTNSFAFSPARITVQSGDTVRWTSSSSAPHTVTGKGFDSGTLNQGDDYSHRFTNPGSFSYICSIHPFMKGTVTVKGDGSGGGGSGGGSSDRGGSSGGSSGSGSSGSGGSSGAGASSTSAGSSGASGGSGQLPITGLALVPLGGLGLGLMLLGLLLGRRADYY